MIILKIGLMGIEAMVATFIVITVVTVFNALMNQLAKEHE